MNSAVGSSVPADVVAPPATTREMPRFRLYTLRAAYLIMAAGLGAFVWPNVIHHTNEFVATRGIQVSLLAGLGLTAALGLRYPLKMLPILLFERTWKAIHLMAFALPLWSGPSDQRRHRRGHQSRVDGRYFYFSHPMPLCLSRLRP